MKSNKQILSPKLQLRRNMLHHFHSFLHLSKIDIIVSHFVNSEGAIILMYHSVASNKNARWIDPSNHIPEYVFEKHMKFLAKKRNVISLDSLVNSIKSNKALCRGTTVITFDDGYLDNLTIAAPILKKYNLPATIYLTTGYIEREENQWIDQLFTCFRERTQDQLIIPEIFADQIELNDPVSRWNAYSHISKYLMESTYEQRTEMINSIKKQLLPELTPPKLTMNWDDVRNLVNNNENIALGSHTYNHIDISGTDDHTIKSEIHMSTEDIERETGQRPVHFSCPYSRTRKNLPEILLKSGYISSVSDSADLLINSKSFQYNLGRVESPVSLSRLGHYTSGNYPAISKFIMRGRY